MKPRVENAAQLGAMLASRLNDRQQTREQAVPAWRLVEELQTLARRSHRNAERMCNGELPECPKCHGDGWNCKACAETGYPALAREAKAVDRLRDALKPYRLRVYEQGDPRGWPLYLIPEEAIPTAQKFMEGKRAEAYIYPSDPPEGPALAVLQERWIGSNYNSQGVAVCPH